MEKQSTNDEIDLGLVFKKIGEAWNGFLIWIFNCIQFAKRNWVLLLILAVVGGGLGYLWEKNSKGRYEAILLIKANFDSSNYVYDAIDKVRSKEKEPWFREKYEFNNDVNVIKEIEIEPVVDILALLEATNDENRILEQYLSEADFEDDILLSEAFINEYPLHRITIEISGEGNNDAITGLLNYLNDNPFYKQAQPILINEVKQQIKHHETSIKGINEVLFSYKDSLLNTGNTQFMVKSNQTTNLHWLVEEKTNLMETIADLKKNLLTMDKIVYVVNDSKIRYKYKITDNKKIVLPLVLIILFILVYGFRNFYKKISHLSNI